MGRRLPLRALALIAVVTLAYHYSLGTLVRGLGLQTPLAYLGLVPVIALILAWVRLATAKPQVEIHDRQVDYIVGVAFALAAFGLVAFLPETLGTRFWLYRLDLLSLPLFTAGAVAILYGVRRLWELKFPIAFLVLAWPLLYAPLVGDAMQGFTDATAAALAAISAAVPLATVSPGDSSVFFIGQGRGAFPVTIGSACAGVNSLVGFILIGAALAYVVRGPILRRGLWLASGLIVIWLLNIARIELIFAVGAGFGRQAALDILHPVAGLIVFNLGVVGMLAAVPKAGLRFVELPTGAAREHAFRNPGARLGRAAVAAGGLALLLGGLNAGFARFEAMATPLGEAKRLEPFDIKTAQVPGWQSDFMASNPAARQYFGDSASWDRLQYTPGPAASLASSVPIYVDVIETDDPGTFAAYGLEACYGFHGYRIESIAQADIGAGVTAEVIDYHNRKIDADWSAIVWEWPFQADGRTRFERIILFVASGPVSEYEGVPAIDVASQSPRFAETDRFLTALAREIVQSQLYTAAVP